MGSSQTLYARSGDVHIAYRTLGDGPIDLVFMPLWTCSHVDVIWEDPAAAAFFEHIASFARLILIDRRGLGLSDRVSGLVGILEEQVDDICAVLDAIGSKRAAVWGWADSVTPAVMFATAFPERCAALVLYAPSVWGMWSPDNPWGSRREEIEAWKRVAEENWGNGYSINVLAPSVAGDERITERYARLERVAAPPGIVSSLIEMSYAADFRDILATVDVPTAVIARSNLDLPGTVPDAMKFVASLIEGSTYIEVPGGDYIPWFEEPGALLGEVEAFLTGSRHSASLDRVLATILFTDVVGSTEHAARSGDRAWRRVLDQHDALVARQVERFRGRAVRSTGDGMLATFDGPARAIRCALAIRDGVRALGLEIRAGLHTGEVETRGEHIDGIAVHIGARIAALAGDGEIFVSGSVPPLVTGSGLAFDDRGEHVLKGVPGVWRVYGVR